MRRFIIAAATAGIAVLLSVPFALADESLDPRLAFRIDRIEPAIVGVDVTVAPTAIGHVPPQVELNNASGTDLVILDSGNVAMLRIGPSGVYGNDRSTQLATALNPKSKATPSPGGPQPLWRKIGPGTRMRWYEARARYDGHGPKEADKPAVLVQWRIPAVHASRTLHIIGSVRWRPILGDVQPTIVAVTPQDKDVTVRAVPGPLPGLQITNYSQKTIEIVGRDGKPFARVGPNGVEMNVRSPTYADTRRLPPPAPSAPPKWETQQKAPVLLWLEKRAAYVGDPPEKIETSKKRTELGRWTIPGTIGGAPFTISGVNHWVPAPRPPAKTTTPAGRDGPLTTYGLPVGVGLAALIAAAWLSRRRRST